MSETKITCRKCGGNHFTIKCGKEKVVEPKKEEIIIETKKEYKPKREFNDRPKRENKFRKLYKVKVGELPVDMTEEEMMELTHEWGHVQRLRVINYDDNSVAYIEFGFEDEADYFVRALDKTPFESSLIMVGRVD